MMQDVWNLCPHGSSVWHGFSLPCGSRQIAHTPSSWKETTSCAQDRLRTAEAQMCYVLEPMRQQVSAWVALGVDPRRTCAKTNRMNGEACALFHESKVGEGSWVEYRPMTAKRRAIVYE